MRKCKVTFEPFPGSPYSQSAQSDVPFLDRESHEDYDIRTWREKCTINDAGQVCVPAMAFKQSIDTTAYKLGLKVPNRRGATYKNFFSSGFFCMADAPLTISSKPIKKDDAELKVIWANADGIRGSGKRVKRRFPQFQNYTGNVEFTIIDDIITESIFEQHVRAAGLIVGIGRFRPERGGTNGRFRVANIEWADLQL